MRPCTGLLELGRAAIERGTPDEAREFLTETVAGATELSLPSVQVLGRILLATLDETPGGAPDVTDADLERREHEDRMEARYLQYRTSGDAKHLAEAARLLDELATHARPADRQTMLEVVPLHRAIRNARP